MLKDTGRTPINESILMITRKFCHNPRTPKLCLSPCHICMGQRKEETEQVDLQTKNGKKSLNL